MCVAHELASLSINKSLQSWQFFKKKELYICVLYKHREIMSLGNAFLHGMMHGAFDRMFFGGTPFWGCMPFWGCNTYAFFSPLCMNFTPYFSIFDSMPPLPQGQADFDFDTEKIWDEFSKQQKQNSQIQEYFSSIMSQGKTTAETDENEPPEEPAAESLSVENDDEAFNKMLNFVLESEGGYNPNDCGQAGNMGILQSTYDTYRTNKGLATQDVKLLTREEAKDIYYNMYYKASGADKIQDPKLAFQVFDTAVNMGVSAAKSLLEKSGNDPDKFEELRLARYESIAQANPSKAKYLTGWQNRVDNLSDYSDRNFTAIA